MKSEKITINLSAVELAQIDFLVEKGLYASRSDFIRLATRKQTEEHKKEIEQFVDYSAHERTSGSLELATVNQWGLGIWSLDQEYVGEILHAGKKLSIRIIGVLIIDKDVSAEQLRQVLKSVKVSGKIKAEPEAKAIIEELNQKV